MIDWEGIRFIGIIAGVIVRILGGIVLGLNYVTTGNPFRFPNGSPLGSKCHETLKVVHDGNPVPNLAVKDLQNGLWGYTNQSGIWSSDLCIAQVRVSYNGTDYAIGLEDGKVELLSV